MLRSPAKKFSRVAIAMALILKKKEREREAPTQHLWGSDPAVKMC